MELNSDSKSIAENSNLPYAELFEFAPVGYILLDINGIIKGINSTGANLLGSSKHYLLNRPFYKFVPNDYQVACSGVFKKTCDEKQKFVLNVPIIRQDHSSFYAHMECLPVLSPHGDVVQIWTVVVEIYKPSDNKTPEDLNVKISNEKKRTEDLSLNQVDRKFQVLADIAPIGVCITDHLGKCFYINKRWTEMTGLTFEEALGDGWLSGMYHEDRRSILSAWNKMVKSQGNWGFEFRFQTKQGKITWVYGLAAPYGDAQGKTAGYIVVALDITDRKLLEEVQERYCSYLEEIISKQTDEIDSTRKELQKTLIEQYKKETALDVLIQKIEQDKAKQEEIMLQQLSNLVLPYVKKLKECGLQGKQKALVSLIEDNLTQFKSKLFQKISSVHLFMTPTEIQIANLIENGKTTKDIADLLNLSPRTIEFHRDNIRKKLGIKHKQINLRAFLLSKKLSDEISAPNNSIA